MTGFTAIQRSLVVLDVEYTSMTILIIIVQVWINVGRPSAIEYFSGAMWLEGINLMALYNRRRRDVLHSPGPSDWVMIRFLVIACL